MLRNGGLVAAGLVVALTFGLTWWLVRRRCFPEFRSRLDSVGVALLAGLPLLAWRSQSWELALGVLGAVVACAWLVTLGRVERFFPRRWFHETGTGPRWLTGGEILAFFVLLTVAVVALYGWVV